MVARALLFLLLPLVTAEECVAQSSVAIASVDSGAVAQIDSSQIALVNSGSHLMLGSQVLPSSGVGTERELQSWCLNTMQPGIEVRDEIVRRAGVAFIEATVFLPGLELPGRRDINFRFVRDGVPFRARLSHYAFEVPFHLPDGDWGGIFLYLRIPCRFGGSPLGLEERRLEVLMACDFPRRHLAVLIPLRPRQPKR